MEITIQELIQYMNDERNDFIIIVENIEDGGNDDV